LSEGAAVPAPAAARGRRRRRVSPVEQESSDSDVPLVPPRRPRKVRRRHAPVQPRVRRQHARMVEEVDEARADDSNLGDLSDNDQLLLSSRPRSAARVALARYHVDSDTESDRAVTNRLPAALADSSDSEWEGSD